MEHKKIGKFWRPSQRVLKEKQAFEKRREMARSILNPLVVYS